MGELVTCLPARGPLTAAQFLALTPWSRGYAVYMFGERDDEPNVPDEGNPYQPGTADAEAWEAGNMRAAVDVQDEVE